jgi:hypothetical protein
VIAGTVLMLTWYVIQLCFLVHVFSLQVGSVVVPEDGYWHSSPYSPQVWNVSTIVWPGLATQEAVAGLNTSMTSDNISR